ncbi:terminase small subunit [Deinococcus sp. QL22]|uniref:terminase small subunit n=1 Tax=Deinococcus sp. QL22 TaxID=2939437 RepID=UPI0020173ED1|nr:terminase small subunit [Deinococcus sp. QL22]UQN04851.1 terminase small subunit [Deinococcus sp. QL22]
MSPPTTPQPQPQARSEHDAALAPPSGVPDGAKTYRQLLAKLTAKQRQFVKAYVQEPNATKAAKKAGYSDATAYAIGAENLRKPQIAEAVELGFEQTMGKHEVRARTAEVAAASLEDFLTIERVPYTETVVMDAGEALALLTDTLADLSEELGSAGGERSEWIAKEIKRLKRLERKCGRAMEKAEEDNGTPEVAIDVEHKERVVVRIDLEKARQAGKLHLIKKLKETKFGLEVELQDAASARELLGKHYRLWGDRLALENADGSPMKFLVGIPESAL